jgi:thiamine biosynthesis lipoprotein
VSDALRRHVTTEVRVMGTTARLTAVVDEAAETGREHELVELARYRLGELESRWSRFLPDSEVSLLNAASGHPMAVGDDSRLLVRRAVSAWTATDGAFDPTVLDDLVDAGYDRTFTELHDAPDHERPGGAHPAAATRRAASACAQIVVDERDGTVTLPNGVGFDPGGIGKGLAADLVVELMVREGALGSCVDLGGDLRVGGSPPNGDRWVIGVGSIQPAAIGLRSGGVATSATSVRTWVRAGVVRHHLVDPGSGRGTRADVVEASVVAAEAWQADALTKAIFVHGVDRGFELIDALGAAARAVTLDGARESAGWAACSSGLDGRRPS